MDYLGTMGIESASHIRLVSVLALRELALIRPADPLLIREKILIVFLYSSGNRTRKGMLEMP